MLIPGGFNVVVSGRRVEPKPNGVIYRGILAILLTNRFRHWPANLISLRSNMTCR